MNKNDIKLVLVLILLISVFFIFKYFDKSKEKVANVYYEDEIIKTISLSEDGVYTVMGDNGEVVLEVSNNKIRVVEETSERNLCSKQGYGEIIICLPNKIVIKVENDDGELDGVVK